MAVPIPSYDARQGWTFTGECSCPWFPASDRQASVLRHQTRLCVRWRGACVEKEHPGIFITLRGVNLTSSLLQNERRKKKSGAATTHVKLAEKLLAAQMRREALNHAQYVLILLLRNSYTDLNPNPSGKPLRNPRQEVQDYLPLSRSMMTPYTWRILSALAQEPPSKNRLQDPILIQRRRTNFITTIRTSFQRWIWRKLL